MGIFTGETPARPWHRRLSTWHLVALGFNVGLILFSSTEIAGRAADYAFSFYSALLGRPHGPLPALDLRWIAQKSVHVLLFMWLGLLLSSLADGTWRRILLLSLAGSLLLGLSSEALQLLEPGRSASFRDVLLNALSGGMGALAGLLRGRDRSGRPLEPPDPDSAPGDRDNQLESAVRL